MSFTYSNGAKLNVSGLRSETKDSGFESGH